MKIVENALKPYHNGEVRTVVKVQSNSVKTEKEDQSESWLDWQKARNMRFNQDGTIDFLLGEEMKDQWLIEQQSSQ
ncbi:hypothetical protein IMZ31_24125 (plasmid) [Pontibacillus sp. ALD_SL1]|uniref:hypothetical protein n=1 Tax=Pontibacillus sp. ALD_SL1 TaxID=2777185 RepID=UPI001A95A44C|nr:hypothetical protein [Pontibacillus sp. ALD_SL1]QST02540.1 hypothetical protein IMZ31_24125 [Pontibacillus sp. ALD_SL1]